MDKPNIPLEEFVVTNKTYSDINTTVIESAASLSNGVIIITTLEFVKFNNKSYFWRHGRMSVVLLYNFETIFYSKEI